MESKGQRMNESGTAFRFKRNAKIGEAAAEQDDEFLFHSFVDIGDFREIRDIRSPKRIVVGRTGSGKSALLRYLAYDQDHVIELDPEHLSLNFIANNDVLQFFDQLGIKLELFYGLLWKHVLAVELIRHKYHLTTEEKTKGWVDQFLDNFKKKDQTKERALLYLRTWGNKFWNETESRVQQLTTKLAGDLSTGTGINVAALKSEIKSGVSLSEEKKQEIVQHGQRVVNSVQIKELADVIRFLQEDVFTDSHQPFYITIDKLDENWVDDSIRYKLIRALVESIRSFQRVQNVKIIVAIRQDLLQKVYKSTADSGFQEEKYEALMLRIRWNRGQIENMLDKRISTLVQQQYTTRNVKLRELFPEKVGKLAFMDYFIQRTALRPRDAILFVNDCISRSEAAGKVKVQTVFEAEREYSRLRRNSLIHEWSRLYPSLVITITLIERTDPEFKVSSLDKLVVDRVIEELAQMSATTSDSCTSAASIYMEAASGSKNAVVSEILRSLFEVGAIGLRFEGGTGILWAYENSPPNASQIKPNTKVQLHPMFYQALHTRFIG